MRLYGIVLLPDKETATQAVVVNRRVLDLSSDPPIKLRYNERMRELVDGASYVHVFDEEVDTDESWPHISIMHKALAPNTDVLKLVGAVKQAVGRLELRRVVGPFTSYQQRGEYIFRMSSLNAHFERLHLAVAEHVSRIDPEWRMPLSEDIDGLDVDEWKRFGWLHAGKNFLPHVTVAHVPKDKMPLALERMPGARRDPALRDLHSGDLWSSSRIGIGPLGPHGTLTRLVATVSL